MSPRVGRTEIITAVTAVHGAAEKAIRPDPGVLADQILQAAASPQTGAAVGPLTGVADDLADAWALQTASTPTAWQELAAALMTCSAELAAVSNDVVELKPYVAYFGWDREFAPDGAATAQKLFDLAVVEQALLPVGAGPYQPVELVQLSADAPYRRHRRRRGRHTPVARAELGVPAAVAASRNAPAIRGIRPAWPTVARRDAEVGWEYRAQFGCPLCRGLCSPSPRAY